MVVIPILENIYEYDYRLNWIHAKMERNYHGISIYFEGWNLSKKQRNFQKRMNFPLILNLNMKSAWNDNLKK